MINDEQKELEFYAEWSEIEPYLEKMTETELQKLLVFINLTGKAKIQGKLLQNSNFYH